ncbi:aldehyde dehydrogenase family protein [Patulibacter defluvii]|uniref:aldehyde dehydrogenase family protein n=1 Tax=Patulibacter defluvii TaxID=3095358 RepID=UPI002A761A33|nr:aldehyde dehydrogenase family protein [Patulibacter sp. DM4]
MSAPFANQPILDLRRPAERQRLSDALAGLDARLPLRVPVLIDGRARHGEQLRSLDPGDQRRTVATSAAATADEVERAVAVAGPAGRAWAATAVAERAAILRRAADLLAEERAALAALAVRECAKPWAQADADVCEAIDFLRYYAERAVALLGGEGEERLLQPPGERNALRYRARGVCAVIAPWNFPLAIPCGMTAAALATGNAVLLKPAEQSPACGARLVELLQRAGVPAGALALLPGEGQVGAALVEHPGVATIAFTGSAAVGLEIVRRAAEVRPGQRQLKRVAAEMGGKNCVVVAADADLDDVVPALLDSAFAFGGQKCSAAARVLVEADVADRLEERLAGALATLVVGQAEGFATDVPPLIEREAQERLRRYHGLVERDGGRLVVGPAPELPAGTGEEDGCWVRPALALDLPPDAALLREEVFGPLLSVERVPDLDAALARIDELPFALTAGVFSRNPRTVRRLVAALPAGNVYVNRGITGAMVARQPFGGNRLSGTGTKAGGPDYLLSFVDPQAVTENTVRHGLVV